jgi:hypothetical protein
MPHDMSTEQLSCKRQSTCYEVFVEGCVGRTSSVTRLDFDGVASE